jgi:hypothetical protein
MAARQPDRTAHRQSDRGGARSVSTTIYLPATDPPQKRPWQLAAAAALLTAWLLFLLYLVLQT